MTDTNTDACPLPPIAWQRGTGWGRDVTAYAREQDHRIADQHFIQAFEITSPDISTIEAIVITSRYRAVFGTVDSATFMASRNLDAAQWDRMIIGRYHEVDIATAICTFIMEGSRFIALGRELVTAVEADPEANLSLAALNQGGPSFYVHAEGTASVSYDGQPLDGFLVSFEDDGAKGKMHLHVTPMTRGEPVVDVVKAPTPTMCLSGADGDETIADAIRSAAARLLVYVERQSDKLFNPEEPDEEETEEGEDGETAKKSLLLERRELTMLDEIEEARRQAAIMVAEADRWARLIGASLTCLVNRGPEAVSGFPPEAPADLIERVRRGGAGARKAEQRLVASGFPRWTRYEIGVTAGHADGSAEQSPVKPEEAAPERPATSEETAPAQGKDRDSVKPDRRKERRLERQGRSTGETVPTPPAARPAIVEAPVAAVVTDMPETPTSTWTTWAPTIAKHDPELLDALNDKLRRCFKDLPSLDSRNWEVAFPPALASMVMRRAHVAQMPRESHDATRRRLAADIRPRLEGLPVLLQRIRAEEAANGGRILAYEIERASISRDPDDHVIEAAAHPILVSVKGDDDLARRILFAGVEREPNYVQDRTVVIRAWRVERTLHLMGIVHDGCLTGFRRIEYDLDDRSATVFDAEADDGDVDGLLDALYAPIADVVLGPVDESEAWRYERRARPQRGSAPFEIAAPAPSATRVTGDAVPAVTEWSPVDADFASWDDVRQECPAMTAGKFFAVSDVMDRNAVARAVLRTLEHDGDARDVRNALTRHLASWTGDARIDLLTTPDIADDASLTSIGDRDGVLVVSDVALVEHASPGLVTGPQTSREAPLCVLYRIRGDDASALVIRPTSDNLINLAQWIRLDAEPCDEESDLAWYVRGAICEALVGRRAPAPRAEVVMTLPGRARAVGRIAGNREGPRRIVAQARIRPENMQLAAAAAASWFDAQVSRHGDALIEDRRHEGDWTIEHESDDRGVQSRWSVTLHVADDEPGALDIFVRTTLATGVKPRLPTLVREIAAATPTDGPDGRLTVHPRSVRTRSDLNDLLRHLQSGDRQLPTLVMTQDRQGQYARDPADIARQALGAMNVWLIADHMTYELSDTLGQEYRTFSGAVRLFQPRFDPDVDPASRHPRIMNDAGVERAIADVISRATAATTTRYNIPDPLSPSARTVEPPVVNDEPTLPFADEPLSGREAFPAPAPQMPDAVEEPEAASDEVRASAPVADEIETELAQTDADAIADPITTTPVAAEAIADTVASERDAAEQADRVAPGPVLEKAGPIPETAKPVTAAKPAPETASPTQAPPAPTSDAPSFDMDQLVSAVDAAVARRLSDMGIGGLAAAMSTLSERVSALSEAGNARSAEIEARDAEIVRLREEMRVERETTQELLTEAETQRQSAIDEVETLRQAFNERRRGELRGTVANQWPSDLSGLAEWLEQNVLPNVVITPKAWRAMRKIRYTDMERLCSTLQLLDGAYVDMRAGEDGAKQRWDDGLKELRLESKKQSQNGKGIRGGNEYRFEHEGVRWEMDFHLRGNESLHNEHDRLLRIYYAYDKERGRVLIGHLPTHLTTIDS